MLHANASLPKSQLCSVTLLGNLVAKPEIRYRANPVSAITEIIIATRTQWLDKNTNQYKEWTSYHPVKVEGDLVERVLLNAEKGDVILVQGYLNNIKATHSSDKAYAPIVHANVIEKFAKGYTQSINQVLCSAHLATPPQLITTQNNKQLAQTTITIEQQVYLIAKQSWQSFTLTRELHVWGKQAQVLMEKAEVGDSVVIEGRLSYATGAAKTQYIEAKTLHLLKN